MQFRFITLFLFYIAVFMKNVPIYYGKSLPRDATRNVVFYGTVFSFLQLKVHIEPSPNGN